MTIAGDKPGSRSGHERDRVKFPLFESKGPRKLDIPNDIAYRSQLAEDIERYATLVRPCHQVRYPELVEGSILLRARCEKRLN
jgi:hypothetical protein